jgi:hypothetical protein
MDFDEVLGRQVKQVCTGHGVAVMTLGWYRCFALQVYKTRKRVQGPDLALVVQALVERYVELGLERGVLTDIAYHVFNVGPLTGTGRRSRRRRWSASGLRAWAMKEPARLNRRRG